MDQAEIDALMKASKPAAKPAGAKVAVPAVPAATVKAAVAVPPKVVVEAPVPEVKTEGASKAGALGANEADGRVISEIDSVTSVTERETNKVMDQLDLISQLVGRQQGLIKDVMKHPGAQDPAVQEAIRQVMDASTDIQDKVFGAMDLMQFQDITRQKLERIVFHLRQIHDYIVDLLGAGVKSGEPERASISRTIQHTGTTPDEKKADADAVVEEFMRNKSKG